MIAKASPWRVLSSAVTYADRWLKVRSDHCVTAEGHDVSPYHVLEYPDWINVVAFTRDQRLVLVHEYRHGRAEVVTGLVSGGVETDDGPDGAENAARRELAEETGYLAADFLKILDCYPNPATQNNRVTTFLAFDAEPSGTRMFTPSEAIEVVLGDFEAVLMGLRSGEIRMQAMHVAALWTAAARILADDSLPAPAARLRRGLWSSGF